MFFPLGDPSGIRWGIHWGIRWGIRWGIHWGIRWGSVWPRSPARPRPRGQNALQTHFQTHFKRTLEASQLNPHGSQTHRKRNLPDNPKRTSKRIFRNYRISRVSRRQIFTRQRLSVSSTSQSFMSCLCRGCRKLYMCVI